MECLVNKIHNVLAENLKPGFLKRVLKFIYWKLPRSLRASNITTPTLEAIAGLKEKRFVQIGANNGVMDDPLYKYLIASPWIGLMVEPNPAMIDELKNNHKNTVSTLSFSNNAIGKQGKFTLYWSPLNPGVASFDKLHVVKHLGSDQDSIEEVVVDCIGFNDLLNQFPAFNCCDLLILDTEGFDAKIIMSIDFNRFYSDVILFEYIHTEPNELETVSTLLEKQGYALYDCRLDRVCIHKNTKNVALQKVLMNAYNL